MIHMVGLENQELSWLKLMVKLLRNPNPVVGELARQALKYVEAVGDAAAAEVEAQRPHAPSLIRTGTSAKNE